MRIIGRERLNFEAQVGIDNKLDILCQLFIDIKFVKLIIKLEELKRTYC